MLGGSGCADKRYRRIAEEGLQALARLLVASLATSNGSIGVYARVRYSELLRNSMRNGL